MVVIGHNCHNFLCLKGCKIKLMELLSQEQRNVLLSFYYHFKFVNDVKDII